LIVEELQIQKFEIPFDYKANFTGNQDDLFEHDVGGEWRRETEPSLGRF
jgi:hypothetical protein